MLPKPPWHAKSPPSPPPQKPSLSLQSTAPYWARDLRKFRPASVQNVVPFSPPNRLPNQQNDRDLTRNLRLAYTAPSDIAGSVGPTLPRHRSRLLYSVPASGPHRSSHGIEFHLPVSTISTGNRRFPGGPEAGM